ncbi:pentraxin-4 [Lepus europaeus]|uniref:pentraxin-4 n=1 Tax=Lepus europaeus TaxID=9983 RepID=UPI002B495939|nr:pentraxin-4 [Lepus europaeus]XP_062036985.1 pentraxin-4 [Lepus europaeus]
MGCLGSIALSVLVCVPLCLCGASAQDAGPAGPRRPFLERLRRLEGQFRKLQEVTLVHLQAIAHSYNASLGVQAQLQGLAAESRAAALALNQSQAAVQGDLVQLKTWARKAQRRSRRVGARLRALALALSEKSARRSQEEKQHQAQRDAVSGLGLDVRALQDALARLTLHVHGQDARLAALEGRQPTANPGTTALGLTPTPARAPPAQSGPGPHRQGPGASPGPRSPAQNLGAGRQQTREPPAPGSHQELTRAAVTQRDPPQWVPTPQGPGEACSLGPVLVFPNASTENVVFLGLGLPVALRALSFCSWLRTAPGRLGTLLSYATEDNDNKLVLHGRDSLAPGTVHLVIGDPAFRELPLQPLLDGHWHHVCIIWTSLQGRYWLHVDRALVAAGSRFREGYEIPPGGSLVLGQEQDRVGGGFDSSEAFVGSMSGLAIWDRALVPREVTNLATGKEMPTGAILTLANASTGGFVQRVGCTCPGSCL